MSTVIHAAGRALVPAADFLSPYDFFRDLTNPALAFLPRALLIAVVAALVCGSVGVHVVLRGMAFIGDAVAHSVFPGLAIAFVCGGSLVLGGALAGVVTAVLVALLAQNRRLKEDSVIGVLFVGAFALGVAIIARAPGYAGSLQDFLFGSITGISGVGCVPWCWLARCSCCSCCSWRTGPSWP